MYKGTNKWGSIKFLTSSCTHHRYYKESPKISSKVWFFRLLGLLSKYPVYIAQFVSIFQNHTSRSPNGTRVLISKRNEQLSGNPIELKTASFKLSHYQISSKTLNFSSK